MASMPLAANTVEAFLKKLEADTRVPGTTLGRILCQNSILRQNGVELPRNANDSDSTLAWSLGLGELTSPKRFFYGLTLEEVLKLARKGQ